MQQQLRAEFRATLPAIQSALKIGDETMRAQFDIPASDLHEALKLALMHGKILHVVVVAEGGE